MSWYELSQNKSSWYKVSQINDFSDRNVWNKKISDLKDIVIYLMKMSKIVSHTGSGTKKMLLEILDTKKLSSYPEIEKALEGSVRYCLDSPQKFAEICKESVGKILLRISKFEKQRDYFSNDIMAKKFRK